MAHLSDLLAAFQMFPKKWWQWLTVVLVTAGLSFAALASLAGLLLYPELPSLEALTDYRPKIPLRVLSEDGLVIGEFGEERRALVKIDGVPVALKQAILAAEDERFYRHGGVDTLGVLRAALSNLTSGGAREGASTITMQVARNFFLSREKTLKRKLNEALLAIKIEHSLSKDQILELYINQIYLGQRAYGFAAASQVYFAKPLGQLSVAEIAMLAGLPKAPSRFNPHANPRRATLRQHYVLRRMHQLKYLSDTQYRQALRQPLHFRRARQSTDLAADHAAEIVRQTLYDRYGDSIYGSGMTVHTTLRKTPQEAAHQAVQQGVRDYDRRHGYRGPEGRVVLAQDTGAALEARLEDALADFPEARELLPAVVLEATPVQMRLYVRSVGLVQVEGAGLTLVRERLAGPLARRLKPGHVVRVQPLGAAWQVTQLPQVEAALIGMDPRTGAVRALVGGFDFVRNKFNHVTQAWRQPGSSFKPFIYSAALEKGYTPASMIEDEALVVSADQTGSGEAWAPRNFDDRFDGPIRLRSALTRSKNMVSIRILQGIGTNYAQDYITRFGFDAAHHPPYLSMALGAGSVTLWQMAGAYAVFANGGYQVTPYLIDRIVDAQGKVIEQTQPTGAGQGAPQVIDARNAYLMTSMMQDVVRIGTAAKARELGRSDLAGKTGTTNNHMDAWFAGYNPAQVAVAWLGYDQPRTLGPHETGGSAALPMWISYMAQALRGVPEEFPPPPAGVTAVKINPATGARAPETEGGMYDYFYDEFFPPEPSGSPAARAGAADTGTDALY